MLSYLLSSAAAHFLAIPTARTFVLYTPLVQCQPVATRHAAHMQASTREPAAYTGAAHEWVAASRTRLRMQVFIASQRLQAKGTRDWAAILIHGTWAARKKIQSTVTRMYTRAHRRGCDGPGTYGECSATGAHGDGGAGTWRRDCRLDQ